MLSFCDFIQVFIFTSNHNYQYRSNFSSNLGVSGVQTKLQDTGCYRRGQLPGWKNLVSSNN